jgi:predicted amidohydrolase YtcJ
VDRGPARSRRGWAYPFRQLADLGIPLLGSSDAPIEAIDPWAAMRAAVDSPVAYLAPGAVGPVEALRMYVGGLRPPAEAEDLLRAGASADLVVTSVRSLEELLLTRGPPVREVWRAGAPLPSPSRSGNA